MVRSIALLLFLSAALSASAEDSFVAGPPILIGDATPQPWARSASARCLATDGDETVIVWFQQDAASINAYAVRLDREGKPLALLPRQLLTSERLRIFEPASTFLTALDG